MRCGDFETKLVCHSRPIEGNADVRVYKRGRAEAVKYRATAALLFLAWIIIQTYSLAFSVWSNRENTHICSAFQSLIFIHIGWDIPFCPHGWPALATGHRTVDSRSSLHGDEQDLGRYPAYWKHSLLLTFRNGEGGRAQSAGSVGVGVGDGVWHRAGGTNF